MRSHFNIGKNYVSKSPASRGSIGGKHESDQLMMPTEHSLMKTNILLLLALAGVIVGCATPSTEVATLHDTVTGQTTGLIVNNYLAADTPGPPDLWLNASRVPKGFTGESFYLEVRYQSSIDKGWLHISAGPSLVMVVDGIPLSYRGAGSMYARETTATGGLIEQAIYNVPTDDLRKIAFAKTVSVRVLGDKGVMERQFRPDNFARFKEFSLKHVR